MKQRRKDNAGESLVAHPASGGTFCAPVSSRTPQAKKLTPSTVPPFEIDRETLERIQAISTTHYAVAQKCLADGRFVLIDTPATGVP
jgi:hypothetical protein